MCCGFVSALKAGWGDGWVDVYRKLLEVADLQHLITCSDPAPPGCRGAAEHFSSNVLRRQAEVLGTGWAQAYHSRGALRTRLESLWVKAPLRSQCMSKLRSPHHSFRLSYPYGTQGVRGGPETPCQPKWPPLRSHVSWAHDPSALVTAPTSVLGTV